MIAGLVVATLGSSCMTGVTLLRGGDPNPAVIFAAVPDYFIGLGFNEIGEPPDDDGTEWVAATIIVDLAVAVTIMVMVARGK